MGTLDKRMSEGGSRNGYHLGKTIDDRILPDLAREMGVVNKKPIKCLYFVQGAWAAKWRNLTDWCRL